MFAERFILLTERGMSLMKGIGLIVSGLVIGLIVSIAFNQRFSSEQKSVAPVPGGSTEEINVLRANVDQQLAGIKEQLATLSNAVDDLTEQLASVDVPPEETPRTLRDGDNIRQSGRTPAPVRDPGMIQRMAARQLAAQQDDPERIRAAGFTQDRIDWLDRRVEELQMEARRSQADELDPLEIMMHATEPHSLLRPEIGDDEYERYLQAKGLRTTVEISRILASSPAERGGLSEGDEIVSYGGERVFSFLELSSLAAQRNSGESVVVEIRRDGQTMQLTIAGGDMGIDSCAINCR
jgi:hypothetical protein